MSDVVQVPTELIDRLWATAYITTHPTEHTELWGEVLVKVADIQSFVEAARAIAELVPKKYPSRDGAQT